MDWFEMRLIKAGWVCIQCGNNKKIVSLYILYHRAIALSMKMYFFHFFLFPLYSLCSSSFSPCSIPPSLDMRQIKHSKHFWRNILCNASICSSLIWFVYQCSEQIGWLDSDPFLPVLFCSVFHCHWCSSQ